MTTALPRNAIFARVFVPFAAGYFLSYTFRSINGVAAPELIADFALGPWDIGFLTSAYFLSFAAAQIPLGVALDRYGPRRTEAFLLLFAAAGSLVFALAEGRTGLIVGRALIGLGVSACLMGSFKAFVTWYPRERLPFINGCVLAVGSAGALAATTPVEWALGLAGWRPLFIGLGAATFLSAALIALAVPENPTAGPAGSLRGIWAGVRQVFGARVFWALAPAAALHQGVYQSFQGLWAGRWLADVGGLERATVVDLLFVLAVAMAAGYLALGALTERLARRGIPPFAVAGTGMAIFILTQLPIVFGATHWGLEIALLFGFFGTSSTLTYAILSQEFPQALSGRVNTALNLLVFVAAFSVQAGVGAIVELWPTQAGGGYAPDGYRAAFAVMLILDSAGFAWLMWSWRSRRIRSS